jgi:hypothetical protein
VFYGASVPDRIARAQTESGEPPQALAGETVAAGSPGARAATLAWIKSPGHCANLLSARYSAVGTGYAQDEFTPTSNFVDNGSLRRYEQNDVQVFTLRSSCLWRPAPASPAWARRWPGPSLF